MQSLFWNTQDGKRNVTWEPTFTVDKEITDRWSVFAEYAGDFLRLSGSQPIAHFGTAYRITRKQQIDSHLGFGLSSSSLGRESFGGAVAGEKLSTNSGPLEISFSRSAVACRSSRDETLLESAEKNGLWLPSGCRQGVCGTCATKLLSGKVRMEIEQALSDAQRAQGGILPCVSRPLSDVTLDA